jgi:Sortase domain
MPATIRRRLLPLLIAIAISAPGGAATVGQAAVGAASDAQAITYPYLGRFSFPVANGLVKSVYDWGCRGGTVPNLVLRWDCAGKNNMYLLGHASSVFNPVLDAWRDGRLKGGKLAYWKRSGGVTQTYKVAWVRLVPKSYIWNGLTGDKWAWNATTRKTITLQTCWGTASAYRLIVRLVLVT